MQTVLPVLNSSPSNNSRERGARNKALQAMPKPKTGSPSSKGGSVMGHYTGLRAPLSYVQAAQEMLRASQAERRVAQPRLSKRARQGGFRGFEGQGQGQSPSFTAAYAPTFVWDCHQSRHSYVQTVSVLPNSLMRLGAADEPHLSCDRAQLRLNPSLSTSGCHNHQLCWIRCQYLA